MSGQMMLFGGEIQLQRLTKLGDPLEKMNTAIDWEIFRPIIRARVRKENYDKGGRPPLDDILMFKTIMLQDWNNISDDNMEFMINDRLSFQRFLGLELGEKAPDSKTIWLFKENLGSKGMRELFDLLNQKLEEMRVVTRKGTLVDATFVNQPRQRNSREENKTIKEGGIPEDWQKPENAHKFAQKDTDARWAKKGNETHFGHKDHVKVDKDSKIIVDFTVTSANVHDINEFEGILDVKDNEVWLDSAYASAEHVARIMEQYPDIILHICEKGTKNKPLTEEQKESNRVKSKVRSRVEHVFGYMTRFMGGIYIRTIGKERAAREICGMNLAYNLKRVAFLVNSKQMSAVS